MQTLIERLPGAVYQVSFSCEGSFQFNYLSPQFEQLFELDSYAVLADASVFLNRIHPDDLSAVLTQVDASRLSLTPFQWEFRMQISAGTRWVHFHSLPFRNADGSTTWTGQFFDISLQRQKDRDLKHQQFLLESARKLAQLGLWEYDLSSSKISWSDEVFDIHGIPREQGEPDMESYSRLWHPDDFPVLMAAVNRAVEQGESYSFDLRAVSPASGEIRHVSATGALMRHPYSGAPERLYGTVLDITHRKELEATLAAARDAAEQNAQAKANFLSTMSHELRTPLNGIVGMTSVLRGTALTAQQRDYCETIHQSAEALLSVVNDILDWSRIESGKITLEAIPFSLLDSIQSTLDILRPTAKAKGLALNFEHPKALPLLVGDPGRLRQILLNLTANAIKFTERGSVTIRLNDWQRGASLLTTSIEVIDTGIGITPKQKERLFQRFSQADASTTRRFGGSGLGLAISKSLTELMGGQIGVDSTFGEGSTFWLTLEFPISETPLPAASPSATHHSRGLRILIAEDNTVNQKIASIILETAGHQIQIADNGLAAIESIRSGDFDLVLMDCRMPELDGFEATRRIRSMVSHPIPIIGLTASAMINDRESCISAGMSDYMAKPYRAEQLLQMIDKWAANAPSASSGSYSPSTGIPPASSAS